MSRKLPKILALDDDRSWLSQVPLILEDECEVHTHSTIDQGLEAIASNFYDVILLDINFENDARSGLDVFRLIHAADRGADVIVISGETRPDRLIQIMNAGVTQFLPKPVPPEEVRAAISLTLQHRAMKLRALNLSTVKGGALIGSSPAMLKLKEDIEFIVSSGTKDILILGETGTGKEVVAQAIAYKADPSKRLIPIHCGAISDGLAESELFGHVRGAFTGAERERASAFEVVGGGFVFLDEIGDMPLNQQAKLLRVLQERKVQRVGSIEEREVNFRTISATNIGIEEAILSKRFREDLFYRIAGTQIRIPPLRERIEDVPELVHHFLAQHKSKKIGITNDALSLLQIYHWPGNVRQLKATIESIATRVRDFTIRDKDICQALPQAAALFGTKAAQSLIGRYGAALLVKEKERYESAIKKANDQEEAASELGVSRSTLYRRRKELGLVRGRRKAQEESIRPADIQIT